MYLGGFFLTLVKTIVCQLFYRDLKRKKRLYPTTFIHSYLNPCCFLHNCSLISLFHSGGVVLTFRSTKITNIKYYGWTFEWEYKNLQNIHCNNWGWMFHIIDKYFNIWKTNKFVRQFMWRENNFKSRTSYQHIYTINSCSNYLLTFIIICLKFSVHIP